MFPLVGRRIGGAPFGRAESGRASCRQLRSLCSLAGGYECLALRADGRLAASINYPIGE
ncbi:MAG: hypothetical protein J6X49_17235 [Victivallales bacterium]|nr:hypothetical protein [Victivallales bacterium]